MVILTDVVDIFVVYGVVLNEHLQVGINRGRDVAVSLVGHDIFGCTEESLKIGVWVVVLKGNIMVLLRVVVVIYDLGVDRLVDVRFMLIWLVLQHGVVKVVGWVMGVVVERLLLVGYLVVMQGLLLVLVVVRIWRKAMVVVLLLRLLLLVVVETLGGLKRLRWRYDGDVAGICICARAGAGAWRKRQHSIVTLQSQDSPRSRNAGRY